MFQYLSDQMIVALAALGAVGVFALGSWGGWPYIVGLYVGGAIGYCVKEYLIAHPE